MTVSYLTSPTTDMWASAANAIVGAGTYSSRTHSRNAMLAGILASVSPSTTFNQFNTSYTGLLAAILNALGTPASALTMGEGQLLALLSTALGTSASSLTSGHSKLIENIGNTTGVVALDLNFLSGTLDPSITFTRSGTGATYFNSSGVLTAAGANVARFDCDPVTLALRGLLMEGARTNGIRNPRAEGAVPGTPGTYPTNWSQSNNVGIAPAVVGTGSEDGIPYIDLRFVGTTAAGTQSNVFFEVANNIAAANAQAWAASLFVRVVGGDKTNLSVLSVLLQQSDSGGASLASNGIISGVASVTTAALRTQRYSGTFTTNNASTAFVRTFLQVTWAAAPAAIDVTLRIGAPQLELGSFASSVMLPPVSSPGATTRAVDAATAVFSVAAGGALSAMASGVFEGFVPSAAQNFLQVDDGTSANRLILFKGTTSLASVNATLSSATNVTTTGSALSAGSLIKVSAAWANSPASVQISLNGAAPATASSPPASVPAMTTLRLANTSTGSSPGFVWLQRIQMALRAWSASELQAKST